MCSHEDCKFDTFYNIDGAHYCKSHCPTELDVCGVIKKDGKECPCPSRRSYKGVSTCLVHIPKSSEVTNCSICLDDCPIGTKPTQCGHFFHAKCIKEWKKQDNGDTCPMCRHEISKNKRNAIEERVVTIARYSADPEEFMANLILELSARELRVVSQLLGRVIAA